jgi:hypothetical protein
VTGAPPNPGMLANGDKASDIKRVTDVELPTHIFGILHTLPRGKPIWGGSPACVTCGEGMWCRTGSGQARARCFLSCTTYVHLSNMWLPPSCRSTVM